MLIFAQSSSQWEASADTKPCRPIRSKEDYVHAANIIKPTQTIGLTARNTLSAL